MTAGCASQSNTTSEASTPLAKIDEAPVQTTAPAERGADDTATETTAPVEEKSTRLVCRKIKPTGSRFGERVCMRPEQWEKYVGHGKRETERIQSQDLSANPPGG